MALQKITPEVIRDLEAEKLELENKISTLSLELQSKQEENKKAKTDGMTLENKNVGLVQENDGLEATLPLKRAELSDAKNELAKNNQLNANLAVEIEKNVVILKDQSTAIDKGNNDIKITNDKLETVKTQWDSGQTANSALVKTNADLLKNIENLKVNIKALEEQKKTKEDEIATASESWTASLQEIQSKIEEKKGESQKQESIILKNNETITTQEKKIETAKGVIQKEKDAWLEQQTAKEEEWSNKNSMLSQVEQRVDAKKDAVERMIEFGKVNNYLKPDFKL